MTSSRTAKIKLPGVFCDWFEGTSLAQGQDDGDPACEATRIAWEQGCHVNAGNGYYVAVEATGQVLRLLIEYAGYCIAANEDEPYRNELQASRDVIDRARSALGRLDQLTDAKEEV